MVPSKFNGQEPSYFPQSNSYLPGHITITKLEYDALLQIARDYETLKSALYRGGIAPETLGVLVDQPVRKDSAFATTLDWATLAEEEASRASPFHIPNHANGHATLKMPTYNYLPSHPTEGYTSRSISDHIAFRIQQVQTAIHKHDTSNDRWSPSTGDDLGYDDGLEHLTDDVAARDSSTLGTLNITGLSERISYQDLTDVIRGGLIVSIRIHKRDRNALVTMLSGASDFLSHVKRHDLYVQMKRLDVTWSSRQFKLNDHVRRQIEHAGMTRNVVIRNAANSFSEKIIREHMAHIDNLVIISVAIRAPDIYIYTNSVHGAMYARTCMLSRKAYKQYRIECFPDDCADPLPVHASLRDQHIAPLSNQQPRKPSSYNTYKILSIDSESSDSMDFGLRREADDDATLNDSDDEGVKLDAI